LLCAACARVTRAPASRATPLAVVTRALSPTGTVAPAAHVSPVPSATPTATSASPTTTPLTIPAAGRPLRVVYWAEGQLWLWREETGQPAPLASNVADGASRRLSSDGRLVAFRRPAGNERDEIWVAGTDGQGERLVAASEARELWERYPQFADSRTELRLGWVPGTHTLWYDRRLGGFDTGVPYYGQIVRLVDAAGGAPRVVVDSGDVWALAMAPGGRQLAALAERELRLIDAADGGVLYTVPFAPDTLEPYRVLYSPDGRQVLAYTRTGLALVDATTGSRRDFALGYTPYGASEGPGTYPAVQWLEGGDGAWLVVSNAHDWSEAELPTATFSIWRLDIQQGTLTKLQTFTGDPRACLSPDGQWVAYTSFQATKSVGNVKTGEASEYGDRWRPVWPCWPSGAWDPSRAVTPPLKVGPLCGVQVELLEADDGNGAAAAGGAQPLPRPRPTERYGITLVLADGRSRVIADFPQDHRPSIVGYFWGE
jgi:hypothetical protein